MSVASLIGVSLVSLCSFLLLYAYFLFPLLLWVVSHAFPSRQKTIVSSASPLPSVSVIFSYVTEEPEAVSARIRNILDTGYPPECVEALAVSDGAPPATVEALKNLHGTCDNLRLLGLPNALGKTAAQNLAVRHARGDVLVFTDSNTTFEAGAIEALVRPLQDGSVGCCVGLLTYRDPGAERSYWTIENTIKKLETRFHSTLGANGALYAIRRRDYIVLPAAALSDMAEPMLILLLTGRVSCFVPEARAHEATPLGYSTTFVRKRRIVLRALGTLPLLAPALDPLRDPRLAFLFFSHKLLRWSSGPLVLMGLGGAALLPAVGRYVLPSAGLATVLFLIIVALRVDPPVVGLVPHWLTTLVAQLSAWSAFLRGHDVRAWRPVHGVPQSAEERR